MNDESPKPYDLEERTFLFAKHIRSFLKTLPRTIANIEDGRQLIRSSGSIGANYREANESLGEKDFKLRLRIARKEAKESIFWLRLLDTGNDVSLSSQRDALVLEATELMKIVAAILRKAP